VEQVVRVVLPTGPGCHRSCSASATPGTVAAPAPVRPTSWSPVMTIPGPVTPG